MPYFRKLPVVVEAEQLEKDTIIHTLEGPLQGRKGDWLITGVEGEKYPCNAKIFAKTYEPADTCFVDICLDFDGVIHSYTSGWLGTDVIPDPPVEGALAAINHYLDNDLSIAIFSSRSGQEGGVQAMKEWLDGQDRAYSKAEGFTEDEFLQNRLIDRVEFPTQKPAARVYVDDRGLRFDGEWFSVRELKEAMTVWYDPEHQQTNLPDTDEYQGYLSFESELKGPIGFAWIDKDVSLEVMEREAQNGANTLKKPVTLVRYGYPDVEFHPEVKDA